MKLYQKQALTIVYVISLTAALAEPQSSDLYSQAKDALEHGDCNSSIELFTRYKAENESKLKNQVEFLQQINNAINYCKQKPSEPSELELWWKSLFYDRGLDAS